ncbi:DNRLRE domain-containing protein [Streptomyces sp. NPDC051364]|uniref:DNRLRE domain-containing protein n=1 Tax=Streptomyces sp. NPDC051364 TaxID=3155799 RepID=UPI003425AFA1
MSVSALQGTQPAFAAPQPEPQGQAGAATATTAADIASARVAARLSGKRVEALSERTETSTTWANKDGSLTTEVSAGPIRFRDPQGQWRDVDVNLTSAADGSVVSKAHPQGLRLSGKKGTKAQSLAAAQSATATDLVTLGQGDDAITLQWRGGLPAPVLDGTRATYTDAVPGADVVVEATRTGFEQFVEVKAKPEAGFSYTLPLKTKGLKVEQQQDGSVLFTDKKSKKTATMPAPVMWDASVDAASGEHTRRAKVGLKVVKTKDGVDLVITPEAAFLSDPATKYPVTVDPSTSALGNLFDTYVQQGETVDWSNDTELDLGNPGTKNADGTFRTARSFITWNTAPVADALISSAQLSLWNFHSGNTDCSAQPWEVWTSNGPTTASRWTNQPAMVTKMATSTEAKGNPGCASQPDGWVNADVTSLVQQWANNKWTSSSMGLRATDENNTKQWKRVNSANAASNVPKLTVTYNYRPRTGTKQEAGAPFFSYGGAYVVNSVTPVLRDTFVDANGDKVNGTFQIFDSATDTQVGNVLVSPYVPSGQVASVTVPAGVLTNGKTYKFRTSPYDGSHYNTGWSAWKTFTVDTSAPSAPSAVTSTDYPSNGWVKGAGQAGTFSITPPAADHNWLEWSLDGETWTKVPTDGASGAKAISVTPPKDGTHTLEVRAVDKADNKSEPVAYTFHAGPGGFVQPGAGDRTARRLPLLAEADGAKYDKASFSWRRSEADAWTQIPPGHVTTGGTPLTAWPVPLTGGKTAPLVWNATDTVDPDGSVQIKADFTGPNAATGATEPLTAVVDRNASGATSSEAGPGSVNLLTGNFGLSADDASAFGLSVSRTASSRTPDKGATQEGQAPIFGKEWVAGTVAEVGTADYSHIRRISDTSVAVIDSKGDELHFTANAAKNGWIPEPGAEGLVLTGSVTGTFTLSDSQGTVTAFTKPDPAVPTWQVSSTLRDGLTNTETKIVSGKTTYQGKAVAFPQWIIAPTSAAQAATCAATPATKGCRMLEFVYPASTTATTFTLGDVLGQVKSVRLWATAPGANASTAQEVAAYAYDSSGRLREAWNPQITPTLKTAYEYDSAGHVTRLTPPGELPWTFTYGKAGNTSTAGDGMLLKAARSGLKQATADVEEGTAATAVVYDVPLTGPAAPYGMGTADVKAWGQLDAPTDATAVFPADAVPASNDGGSLTAAAYKRATVHYMGVSGRESNLAAPGGYISTTEYDRFGNPVRELSAGNRAIALGSDSAAQATRADLGIEGLTTAERADLLANRTVYNDAGTRQLEEFGPLRRIDLTADLKSGTTVLVPVGSSVTARSWTVTEYDAGRPTNGTAKVSDQVTKVTTGAQVREYPTVQGETRAVETVYDWAKGLPIQTIKDPGGLAITETTEYDAQGRVTKQLLPGATGTDAATRVTAYWSATGSGTCQGRPEWADQVCSTGPAGTVTGGGSQPTQLPTTTTEYDWYGNPAKTIDTANGSTRTSTTTFDGAGRATKVATTGGVGQAVPDITTEYDPVTGRAVKTTSATGGSVTKAFDKLGRLISYTDADGGVTTTEYDLLNRPVKVADSAPSTVTYTYDHTAEPRGLPTAVSDSVAGTFQAVYGPNGSVATEKLPGGYTATVRQDPTGAAVARTYTRDSDGTAVYSDTVTETVHGQAASHAGWSTQDYRYDGIGRLTGVDDTSDTLCTRRGYTFDARANRKSLTTATGAPGAGCPTTGGTTANSTHDSADRLVDTGYAYDAFGRTTALPGSTLGYYANDLAYQQTVNGTRQTWALDPTLRFRSWTVETSNGSTWTQTASKLNHYSADGDNPRWIVENVSTGALTRNVDGIAGGLAATTGKTGSIVLQLTNVHGDVALQLPLDAGQAPVALDHDEYGNARADQAATRYGWLGANQRSTEAAGGLTLMGVRLYSPAVGRFLSIDPIAGGSCNRYEYACADPRNKYDLGGTYLMERVQTDCNSFNCVRMRRICESSSHKCSLQWDMWFRRAWSGASIEAGWRWELSVGGHRVTSSSYNHTEVGWYNFHGYWYGNGARGKHSCWGFTCWNDPGDSVQFHAQGIARFGYTRYWWDRFQNFGGGGSYR